MAAAVITRPLSLTLSPAAGARGQSRKCAAYSDTRSGAAMVYVLILLLVISMMGGTLVRGAIAIHRQRLKDEIHAQTVRLAEAGWNRALRALAKSPDYKEETWTLGSESLGPDRKAIVRIEVAAQSDEKRLTVVAEYPLENPNINRVTLTGLVNPKD